MRAVTGDNSHADCFAELVRQSIHPRNPSGLGGLSAGATRAMLWVAIGSGRGDRSRGACWSSVWRGRKVRASQGRMVDNVDRP